MLTRCVTLILKKFDVKWEINDCTDKKKDKIENNIDVFKLNELYEAHATKYFQKIGN